MVAHSVAGVIVEGHGDAPSVQLVNEPFGVGYYTPVPGISRPAHIAPCMTVAVLGARVSLGMSPIMVVPVHIHNQNIKREAVAVRLVNDRQKFLGGVSVPA